MRSIITTVLVVIGAVAFLGINVALTVYRYHDCRRVGHTELYCFTSK